jgi:hypothetical protein
VAAEQATESTAGRPNHWLGFNWQALQHVWRPHCSAARSWGGGGIKLSLLASLLRRDVLRLFAQASRPASMLLCSFDQEQFCCLIQAGIGCVVERPSVKIRVGRNPYLACHILVYTVFRIVYSYRLVYGQQASQHTRAHTSTMLWFPCPPLAILWPHTSLNTPEPACGKMNTDLGNTTGNVQIMW